MSLTSRGLTFLVFLFCLSATSSTPPSTLRHVNLLYRHGDRSPVMVYPKDINQVDSWPDGLGWLSNIGKQQQFELGQYLRDRYGGFINVTHYDHRQIEVQASAVERCLMSAYSNLAGFFPPQGDQVWDPNLPWQPIPVKSSPTDKDNKLAMSESCPRYDQLLTEQYTTQRTLDFVKTKKDFFRMVSKYTGWNETIDDIWSVTDALVCEEAHNMTWNSWVTQDVYREMKEVTVFGWDLLYYTTEMAKLKGGPLLKEMIQNMKAASNGSSGDLKFHMYSAHDTTVAALLNAMKAFNNLQPPYRTLVMVELHKIDNDDIVKMYLRNDTTKAPFDLVAHGCENPCKLSTFEKVLSDTIPQDWYEECKVHSSGLPQLTPASWIALVLGIALVGTVLVGIFVLSRRRKIRYMQV